MQAMTALAEGNAPFWNLGLQPMPVRSKTRRGELGSRPATFQPADVLLRPTGKMPVGRDKQGCLSSEEAADRQSMELSWRCISQHQPQGILPATNETSCTTRNSPSRASRFQNNR